MFDINYQLTPANLESYRRLMMARLTARASRSAWWRSPVAGIVGIIGTIFLIAAFLLFALPRLTGLPFEPISALIGLWAGVILITATSAFRLRGFKAVMYRRDGGTLSPHQAVIDATQLRFSSANAQTVVRWPLLMDLTEAKGLIVLWTEPCQGFVIPRSAFVGETTAQAFCAFARDRIAAFKPVSPNV